MAKGIRGFDGDPYEFLPTISTCSKCGLEKAARDFAVIRHHRGNIKLDPWCRECRREVARERARNKGAEPSPERIRDRPAAPMVTREYEGESKTLAEWAKDPRCKVTKHTLLFRVYNNVLPWPEALTTPVLRKQKPK